MEWYKLSLIYYIYINNSMIVCLTKHRIKHMHRIYLINIFAKPVIVLSKFMLSFIFVIMSGLFDRKRICVIFFLNVC